MTTDEQIEKFTHLITEANNLKISTFKRYETNPEFDKWIRRVKRRIDNLCGEKSTNLNNFNSINFHYYGARGMNGVQVPIDTETYKNGLIKSISLLESIIEEIEEDTYVNNTKEINNVFAIQKSEKNKVFIVHGHDEAAKQEVARFIEKFGLEAIILHEKVSSSKTIIEKIESYMLDVDFGIVLYTECDVGGKDEKSLKSRARQNVVFEHGYLIGKLGRGNVCSLKKGNVETPSDISGVVYLPMEDGSWHLPLVKELEAAGYEIDRGLL